MNTTIKGLHTNVQVLNNSLHETLDHLADQNHSIRLLRENLDQIKHIASALPVTVTTPRRRHPWRDVAPYVAIVVGALFLQTAYQSSASSGRTSVVPHAFETFEFPDLAPKAHNSMATAAAQSEDDDRSTEALQLVYSFKMPSSETTLLEQLAQPEAPGASSPWSVERIDRDLYKVSYRTPGADEPDYVFEADVAANIVVPSPETLQKLDSSRWIAREN